MIAASDYNINEVSSAAIGKAMKVHIYPRETPLEKIQTVNSSKKNQYNAVKYLDVIRHAQGTHNVHHNYHYLKHMDARLTEHGKNQCHALAQSIASERPHLFETELVVTSPLTRCIQTTLLSLEPVLQQQQPIVVAHEMVRETVNYHCDRRRSITEIKKDFPSPAMIDFSFIKHDHDPIWEHYETHLGQEYNRPRESAELHVVADRGRRFFAWLAQRPEEHIVLCTHAAFLRCLWNYGNVSKKMPWQPPQNLNTWTTNGCTDIINKEPVVRFMDEEHGKRMRVDFENCELRSMIVAFTK